MDKIKARLECNNKCIRANTLIKGIYTICQDLININLTKLDIDSKKKYLDVTCNNLKKLMKEIVDLRLYIAFGDAEPEENEK